MATAKSDNVRKDIGGIQIIINGPAFYGKTWRKSLGIVVSVLFTATVTILQLMANPSNSCSTVCLPTFYAMAFGEIQTRTS